MFRGYSTCTHGLKGEGVLKAGSHFIVSDLSVSLWIVEIPQTAHKDREIQGWR